jgi:hypothetical protein
MSAQMKKSTGQSFLVLCLCAHGAGAIAIRGPSLARAGDCRAVTPRAALATATAAWPDLTAEPVMYPWAQAARTVAEVCTIATLSTTSSADGVEGTICARVVAGAPSNTQPVKLLGAAEQLFVVDTDGCPIFGLRAGSQAAADLKSNAKASFSAHSAAGSAQAGCGVTLVGHVSSAPELPKDLMKKLVKRSGIAAEQLMQRSWLKLQPEHVHFTDALQSAEAWVPIAEYAAAEPNPLAEDLGEVMRKVNADHALDLARLAAMLTNADEASTGGTHVCCKARARAHCSGYSTPCIQSGAVPNKLFGNSTPCTQTGALPIAPTQCTTKIDLSHKCSAPELWSPQQKIKRVLRFMCNPNSRKSAGAGDVYKCGLEKCR